MKPCCSTAAPSGSFSPIPGAVAVLVPGYPGIPVPPDRPGDAVAVPMVSRRHHAAPPAPDMFEGCRRARSLWGGVRLEVAGENSPVVLHSFTQLDPDLPPLEVRMGGGVGDLGGEGRAVMSWVGAQPGAGGSRCSPSGSSRS